ncbi:MAG: hypothetical protein LBO71_10955 [Prevotellaceae bacterium]|jgi:hypothetical protein|nr:hypothetical protein [Prevotellaceae bacterium]
MKIPVLITLPVTIALLLSCRQHDEQPEALPTRTIIAYVVADNNLDYFALKDLNEMEQGWSATLDGNLIAYVDRAEGASPPHPVVYKVEHDTTAAIASPIKKVYAEHNSASPDVMRRVLSELIADYPAQSYGLVLWSHGTGWLPAGIASGSGKAGKAARPQSFGKDGTDEMSITDLSNALPCRFDFIIFDACYMGAVEVAYELRNKAGYIIFSPTEVLSAGYPYQEVVGRLFDKPVDYSEVARSFFQSYSALEGAMQSASVSVVKTAELEGLAASFRKLMSDTAQLQYVNSMEVQQLSARPDIPLFDLGSFVAALSANNAGCEEVSKSICSAVVFKEATEKFLDNFTINDFSGMSIFIPDTLATSYHDFYKTNAWFQTSGYGGYFGKLGVGR